MEIVNSVLKRYSNFTILELVLFFIFGVLLFYPFTYLGLTPQQININNFPENIFFIISWFLIYSLIKKMLDVAFRFTSSFREYKFKSEDWPRKWEHQGNIRLWEQDENSLYITDSNSGCLLKHYYWKNVEISFKCKFPQNTDDQTVGIIFRAKSLSDYLMIQINDKSKQIVPHVRMEGGWETTRQPQYNVSFEKDVFFKVKLRAVDEVVELFINDSILLHWIIPTNSDLTSGDKDKKYSDTIVPGIDFRKIYGRIGFRAYQGENAVIKNLKIKRIAGLL